MTYLRNYFKEIDSYLGRNQYDQAIAHCQHILKKYPNSVDALRFLGQAYLENKMFPESAECFEKVIAVIPDDFVSHLAFSAIKEDDRDLDTAIFHMELAFDSQPSNNIVQDELKRLLGKRDGAVPQKVNLSRGALIRMYAKGELFQQAINEINSSLLLNPQRTDLKILLAEMLLKSNNTVQSAELCNQILETHPLCQKANQILYQIYTENGLTENAKAVLERLTAIDPYYTWVAPLAVSVEEVPDEKVDIPRLEFVSAFSSIDNDWNQNLGNELLEIPTSKSTDVSPPPSEIEPSVINPFFTDDSNFHDDFPSTQSEDSPADNPLPDFMKEAGWTPSTTPEVGPPPDLYEISESIPQKSELPDWLKVKASDSFITNSNAILPNDDETSPSIGFNGFENPDFKSNITGEQPGDSPFLDSEVPMSDNNLPEKEPNEENSDWMAQFFDEAKNDQQSSSADKDLPDWLNNFGKEETSVVKPEEELPSWLNSLDPTFVDKTDVPATPLGDIDSILSDLASQPVEESQVDVDHPIDDQQYSSTLDEEDLSTRLEGFTQKREPVAPSFEITSEVPSLISDLPNPENISETIPTSTPVFDEEENQIPAWVKSVLTEPDIPEVLPNEENIIETSVGGPVLEERSELVEEITTEEQGAISKTTSDELLGWLREISPENAEIFEPETTSDTLSDAIDAYTSEPVDDALDQLSELPTESVAVPDSSNDQLEASLEGTEVSFPGSTDPEMKPESESIPFESVEINQALPTDLIPSDEEELAAPEPVFESATPTVRASETPMEAEASESGEIRQLIELVKNHHYDDALQHTLLAKEFENNQDMVLDALLDLKPSLETEFDFMQFLGDVFAKSNQFEKALQAYNQAEALLVQKQES